MQSLNHGYSRASIGEMENSAANKLPGADLLPDGFGDLTSSPATPDQHDQVTDYKEDKLAEADSRPDLVVDDFKSCGSDDGSAEQARTFPVELSEYVGSDTQKLVKTSLQDCVVEHVGSDTQKFVSESVERNSEPELTHSSDGNNKADDICQIIAQSTVQAVEKQAANVQDTLSSESSKTKDTSAVKGKTIKRTFKTEKEFLEFTLSYQKALSERDAAITMRDTLASLCRELQRRNKMLMDVTNKLEKERDDIQLTQLKDGEMLRNQLKEKEDEIALIQQQHAHQLKQKNLELQTADLKYQKLEENIIREHSQMRMYAHVSELLATEKNLRPQLTADGEKFQQFQEALGKCVEVFETFNQEIEKGKTEKSEYTLTQPVDEVMEDENLSLEVMRKLECETIRYAAVHMSKKWFGLGRTYLNSIGFEDMFDSCIVDMIVDEGKITVKSNIRVEKNRKACLRSWFHEYRLITWEYDCKHMVLVNDINNVRAYIPLSQANESHTGCCLELFYDKSKDVYKILHLFNSKVDEFSYRKFFRCEVMELSGLVRLGEGEFVESIWQNVEIPHYVADCLQERLQTFVGNTQIVWYQPNEHMLLKFSIETGDFVVSQLPEPLYAVVPLVMFGLEDMVMFLQVHHELNGTVRAKIWMNENGVWVQKTNYKRRDVNDDVVVPENWGPLNDFYSIDQTFPVKKLVSGRYIVFSDVSHDTRDTYVYDLRTEQTQKLEELALGLRVKSVVHRATRKIN